MKKDGHVHTPFCPHGSTDSLELYLQAAINLGFTELTFAEHAPLPASFEDPTPEKDSSMQLNQMEEYLEELNHHKKKYAHKIKVNIGLEVDYIAGYEGEIASFLNKYGHYLDDSILSVHFLTVKDQYYCMDYSEETFGAIADHLGGVQNVYKLYYQTILASVQADLGMYKPKRIGHMSLARKFNRVFPHEFREVQKIEEILISIKKQGMELDFNTAGLRKPNCLEIYPSPWIVERAIQLDIPFCYGSDAHSAKEVGLNYSEFQKIVK
ncbi:histidinol-phosphatase HisJ [Metabacillus arenae]|uniref:Histidinol-phosphatase n=1 Tax=Metabacillus arenae TaxID=2771434 RepID=A0A926N9R8_9BACI|nr:histidinol-phosphatase HisJ [Metabacillus arenae]MBD1380137.1 histidinol-phosphatase HisJ [Metabacillus arenae]